MKNCKSNQNVWKMDEGTGLNCRDNAKKNNKIYKNG